MASREKKQVVHAHYGITIDIEAINPLLFLAVAIVISRHPGNKILAKKRWSFRTHVWKGQTAQEFWKAPENKSMMQHLEHLGPREQLILKNHAGFTFKTLTFWIKHLDTLQQLEEEAIRQQLEAGQEEEDTESHRHRIFREIHEFILKYLASYSNIVYLTDNPAYDVGFLDCILMQHGFSSIRGDYIECKYIYSMAEGLLKKPYRYKSDMIRALVRKYSLPPISKPRTHDPLDDCLYISCVYEALINACAASRVPETKKSPHMQIQLQMLPMSLPLHSQLTYHDGCLYAQ